MAFQRYTGAVSGLREAQAAFKALPDVARDRLSYASEATAFAIAQRARATVRRRYGWLAQQIGSMVNRRTGTARAGIAVGTFSRAGTGGSALTAHGAISGRPTKYGHLVEFGHGGPHAAPAYPFMIPAAEAERGPYLRRCKDAGAAIERDLSVSRTL